jgi:hypothetical protein
MYLYLVVASECLVAAPPVLKTEWCRRFSANQVRAVGPRILESTSLDGFRLLHQHWLPLRDEASGSIMILRSSKVMSISPAVTDLGISGYPSLAAAARHVR